MKRSTLATFLVCFLVSTYKMMYRGTMYYGTSLAENTIVPWYKHCTMVYTAHVPWYALYHGTLYHCILLA